jgi:hypothetical protein
MQSINALSLTPGAKDWLANTHYPRILHIFDCACNLINERGEVLSIVTQQIGNGPFHLVVENYMCFLDDLKVEAQVSISLTQLRLGNLIIRVTDANLWNPYPDWETLHIHRDSVAEPLIKLRITNYEPLLPKPLVSSLSSVMVNADISSVKIISSQLAGLGIGLTPTGDDVLMGAIYAAWIIHPSEVAGALAKEIANTATPLTTSLSAAWLRAAGRGEAGILWHMFFNALVSGDPLQIQKTMKDILAIGETSGDDAMAGFMGVLRSWWEGAEASRG